MIVLIDNFDSFVYNLARYVEELGFEAVVVRSHHTSVERLAELKPTHLIVSPGPCTPNEAGVTLQAIEHFSASVPILGVCLGHQAIGQVFGAKVIRAPSPCHGKQDTITHKGTGLFAGIPSPLKVGRYHSLILESETLASSLEVIATNEEGVIMGVQHKQFPVFGLQFHPESVLTDSGHALLQNFLTYSIC